jgi:hypothetical protein
VFDRYIQNEAADIYQMHPSQAVFCFPPLPATSTMYDADEGLAAEVKVFQAVQSAARALAATRPGMKFLLFHSVKYGVAGSERDEKWESDIDIVLICCDEEKGWFFENGCLENLAFQIRERYLKIF